MKKKAIVLLLVAIIAAVPAMAASRGSSGDGDFGIGLNVGNATGVGMKFGMGKFDLIANVGLDMFHIGSDGLGLGGEVGAFYEIADIDFKGPHHMPITLGFMVPMGFFFGDQFAMNLGLTAMVGAEYQIPDIPLLFYLRVGGGVDLAIMNGWKVSGLFAGNVGVLWMFE